MIGALKRLGKMNWFAFGFMVALMVVGVFFVYSANSIRDSLRLRSLFIAHAELAAVGICGGFIIAMINYKWLLRFSWLFYLISLALLVAVLLFGTTQMGAKRWVFGIQPSELAKVSTIMLLASFLGRDGARRDIWDFLAASLIVLAPMGLIFLQPDLGTLLVFAPILATMLFVSGTATRVLLTTVGVGVAAVILILGSLILRENPNTSETVKKLCSNVTFFLSEYQEERLMDFLHPERDPMGSGWNRRQSQIAIGSGGAWGKGFLKGDQNILGYLPQQVSANDFIFSVLAEEKGFAGSLFVLLCAGGLLLSTLSVAALSQDPSGRVLCSGVAALIFCHTCINIGMTIGLMPVTGLPLPFVSYGRTFMLAAATMMGLVQSVSTHTARHEAAEVDTTAL